MKNKKKVLAAQEAWKTHRHVAQCPLCENYFPTAKKGEKVFCKKCRAKIKRNGEDGI